MRSFQHVIIIGLCVLLLSATTWAQDSTEVPENTPEAEPQRLRIWWPETLRSPDNLQALDTLNLQTASFVASEANIEIETRIKQVDDIGSVISTMRRAQPVAPGALPTLALVNRQDLLLAQADELAQPFTGMIPTTMQEDMGSILQIGLIDDVLYGLPYVLDVQHLVYRPVDDIAYETWTYDDVLNRGLPFVFPAGRSNGLSNVLLVQYLEAGGNVSIDNTLTLNQAALDTVFTFYEQANEAAMIDGFALNYTSSADYLTAFQSGEVNIGVFNASRYLQLHEQEPDLQIAPLPTASGEAASILNGWMWILVSNEPQEQTLALRYLNWMMTPERQAEYAQSVYMLPSRMTALERGLVGNADIEAYEALLENATLPIAESQGGNLARTIQEAFSSVLTKERTAEQAAQFVIDQQT